MPVAGDPYQAFLTASIFKSCTCTTVVSVLEMPPTSQDTTYQTLQHLTRMFLLAVLLVLVVLMLQSMLHAFVQAPVRICVQVFCVASDATSALA